jgi:PAS domain S-box-containing protein
MIEHAQDIITILAPDGTVRYESPSFEHVLGYQAAEIVGRNVFEFVHEDDRAATLREFERIVREGKVAPVMFRFRHKDGSWRSLETVGSNLLDNPAVQGIIVSSRDVTERQKTAQSVEARRHIRQCVTEVLAEAPHLQEAAPKVLQAIVEGMGWRFGALWRAETDEGRTAVLRCEATFLRRLDNEGHIPVLDRFENTTRQSTFKRGWDVPGVVWETAQPLWFTQGEMFKHVTQFPRAELVVECGLNGILAFPILIGGEVVGVLEFFCGYKVELDADLREMAATIGSQIGHFMQRRRAELAARASEIRQAAVIESALDGIISLDFCGHIIEWNPAAERIFGFERRAVIGHDLSKLIVPPEFREAHLRGIENTVQSGVGPILNQRLELPALRADGERIWVELVATQIPGDGAPSFTGFVRDITASRLAAERLAESQQRYSSLFDYNADGIVSLDKDGNFLTVNPAMETMLGYADSELIGNSFVPFVVEEDRQRVVSHFERAREGEPQHVDMAFLHKDGSCVETMATGVPIIVDEKIVGVYAILHDMTARKRSEELLRKAQQEAEKANLAKSEFLSRMSHELRTPLNAILGFGQLLELDELSALQEESVGQIMKGGRHLLDLINEVLDIARIEAGRLSISPEPIRLQEILGEVAALVRPLAEGRNVSIERIITCPFYALADRQRLKQVLLNLFSNAVKYNARGGMVRAHCEAQDEFLLIHVSDTGPGIAPEKLPLLFAPFERLGAEDGDEEGTGLGLALSKRLVEAMNGTIEAQSTLGQGTTFSVKLPLARSPLESLSEQDGATALPVGIEGDAYKVLYIEDNAPNLRLIERILERYPGVQLISATDGQSGFALACQELPNVILLDLHLPDWHGETVLRRLREEEQTQQIPVVIISADSTPRQIERLMAAGASHYLSKPFDVRELMEVLREHFATENTTNHAQ